MMIYATCVYVVYGLLYFCVRSLCRMQNVYGARGAHFTVLSARSGKGYKWECLLYVYYIIYVYYVNVCALREFHFFCAQRRRLCESSFSFSL